MVFYVIIYTFLILFLIFFAELLLDDQFSS